MDNMTKARLQDRLRRMGQKTTGNKPELIQRLLDQMQGSSPKNKNRGVGDSDEEEEEKGTDEEDGKEEEEDEEEEEESNPLPFQRSADEEDNSSDGGYVSSVPYCVTCYLVATTGVLTSLLNKLCPS